MGVLGKVENLFSIHYSALYRISIIHIMIFNRATPREAILLSAGPIALFAPHEAVCALACMYS